MSEPADAPGPGGHTEDRPTYSESPSRLARLLRAFATLLPGDRLKTAFFLNFIDMPRRVLRDALFAFYRFDHVYAVLREFSRAYQGRSLGP